MSPHEQCDTVKELVHEVKTIKAEQEKLLLRVSDHDTDVNEIFKVQAETRVYVNQILEKITMLETGTLSFMKGLVEKLAIANQIDSKSRDTNLDKVFSLIKYVIGGTIILVLGYIFGKGGMP